MNEQTVLRLFDSHIHLDLYKDPLRIIKAAEANNIGLLAVTNAPFLFKSCRALIPQMSTHRVALGMHPELIPEYGNQIDLFSELLSQTDFIGEVGLDYIAEKNKNNQLMQRKIFEKIMYLCSVSKNKVISIHSRGATSDVNSIVGHRFPGKIILHWFSGTASQLENALENNFYFSINPTMLRSKSGISIIEKIPLQRLLLESDGPFVEINSQSVLPSDIFSVAHAISAIKNLDYIKTVEAISQTSRKILLMSQIL